MGVDYYKCDSCDIGYRDDDESGCFCDCGGSFCSAQCGKLENFTYDYDEGEDDSSQGNGYALIKGVPITCVLCRLVKATDFGLLNALLKHYGITRERAFEIYKKENS